MLICGDFIRFQHHQVIFAIIGGQSNRDGTVAQVLVKKQHPVALRVIHTESEWNCTFTQFRFRIQVVLNRSIRNSMKLVNLSPEVLVFCRYSNSCRRTLKWSLVENIYKKNYAYLFAPFELLRVFMFSKESISWWEDVDTISTLTQHNKSKPLNITMVETQVNSLTTISCMKSSCLPLLNVIAKMCVNIENHAYNHFSFTIL